MTASKIRQLCVDDTQPAFDAIQISSDDELSRTVTMPSGRNFEMSVGTTADHLVVRSPTGRVLLRVVVTDDGPMLSFESARISVAARHHLRLAAPEISVEAHELHTTCTTRTETVRGTRHTCIAQHDELDAAAVLMRGTKGIRMCADGPIELEPPPSAPPRES